VDETFAPIVRLSGTVEVPADKSIAHRALMFAGMAGGASRISGRISGEDVASTRRCMESLGAEVAEEAPGVLVVRGTGWKVPGSADLYCGNSGTTMRLLSGALSGRPGAFTLSGDASLSRRPMRRVAKPLRQMGAVVETDRLGRPPITVRGGALRPITYSPPVASAQVKSAVLLAGMQAEGTTTVREPAPSRDHTERLLQWLGCGVKLGEGRVSITGGDELFRLDGFRIEVPGDLSSAAFWLVAAILAPAGKLEVRGVGLNPGRTGILEVLEAMGADLQVSPSGEEPEPAGTVVARPSPLRATAIEGPMIPRAVDELPLLALAATQAEGTTVIRDAADLRVKETDRIAVLSRGLRTLGASVEDRPDGVVVDGPTPLTGGVVDAGGDHRMAMTFAVAGLIASEPVTVRGWEAAAVSYPGFAEELRRVCR
jgi:3-phosphoshikimate 1-carboxyvinyltransferase